MLLGLALVAWPSFSVIKATNFGGYDEWLILALTSHGLMSMPQANRPLNLLFVLPIGLVAGPSPQAFLAAHLGYLLLGAALVFVLARRLLPGQSRFAWCAAVFSLVWAPSDVARLNAVQMSSYAGFTFGMLGALLLLFSSWRRRSRLVLGAASAAAFLVARAYEGTLPLLAIGGPVLLLFSERRPRDAALLRWLGCYETGVIAASALSAWPLLHRSSSPAYQVSLLGPNPGPLAVLLNLGHQYGFHLGPLFETSWRELAVWPAALAATLFLLTSLPWPRLFRQDPPVARPTLVALAVIGLLLGGLGYLPLILGDVVATPFRMQFLSTPGIALFLAASVELMASALPSRLRGPAVAALGAWIVAVGSARTVFLQSVWDRTSLFPAQASVLRQLTGWAPDLRANTLVVLLGGSGAFPATFSFRHALEVVYGPQVRGFVVGGGDFLYATRVDDGVVRTEPWPAVRDAWSVASTAHRYDELVVARLLGNGTLLIEPRWPPDLRPLPPGARYAPDDRVLARLPEGSGRALLKPSL